MTVNVAQDTVGGEKKWVVSKGTSGMGRPKTFDTKAKAVSHARSIADKGERITAGTTFGGGGSGGGSGGGGGDDPTPEPTPDAWVDDGPGEDGATGA